MNRQFIEALFVVWLLGTILAGVGFQIHCAIDVVFFLFNHLSIH